MKRPNVILLIAICAFAIAIAASFYWPTEPAVRRAGLALQIIGIVTVWLKLRDTRTGFGLPTAVKAFWGWARRWARWLLQKLRPLPVPPINTRVGSITIRGLTGSVAVGVPSDPDATPEWRIGELEKNFARLRCKLAAFEVASGKRAAEQDKALEQETNTRSTRDNELDEKLRNAVVGGIEISEFGIGCLLLGVIMSTVPSEISWALGWVEHLF